MAASYSFDSVMIIYIGVLIPFVSCCCSNFISAGILKYDRYCLKCGERSNIMDRSSELVN